MSFRPQPEPTPITGQYDVVAHVVVRDTHHLRDLALDQFTNREGVDQIETSIIYEARHTFNLAPLDGVPAVPNI